MVCLQRPACYCCCFGAYAGIFGVSSSRPHLVNLFNWVVNVVVPFICQAEMRPECYFTHENLQCYGFILQGGTQTAVAANAIQACFQLPLFPENLAPQSFQAV